MRNPLRGLVFFLSLASGLYLFPVAAGLPGDDPTRFEYSIMRKGKEIGRHIVRFEEEDGGIRVNIEAKIRVKFAFITVFRLTHTASEFWQDGSLVNLTARTERDSKKASVEITALPAYLEIKTRDGINIAPLDSVPTSFTQSGLWKSKKDLSLVLIDTLTGLQRLSDFSPGDQVQLDLDGRVVDVRYYSITRRDTGALTHEFWVDDDGTMMQTHLLTKDGQSIYYRFSGI